MQGACILHACSTVVSRVSAHSRGSAEVALLLSRMESAHQRDRPPVLRYIGLRLSYAICTSSPLTRETMVLHIMALRQL